MAPSREHVHEFWRTLTDQGFRDDGPPGPREQYGPDYYGAFVLDADDNSIEAVYNIGRRGLRRCIDHVWLRVRDVSVSKRFYETIGPVLNFGLAGEGPARAHFGAPTGAFTVTSPDDGWSARRALTQNVQLAFAAPERATVDELQRVALAAGYRRDGAFVLDPDGNTIEAVDRT